MTPQEKRDRERKYRAALREKFGKRQYQITARGNILVFQRTGLEAWILYGAVGDPITESNLGISA